MHGQNHIKNVVYNFSCTKSRCWTNTPTRFGTCRRLLQGVLFQLFTFQNVKWFQTPVRPCVEEMQSFTHDTQFMKLHVGCFDD